MYAFKAFSKNLTATHGNGVFNFEPGKTYEENECKCAQNGFHCAENPLCCLTYYTGEAKYFIVKAEGDINQDGVGSRISCTEITLIKEISLIQMGVYACQYIQKHPKRELESAYAVMDYGTCYKDFLIVRGKKPCAKGKTGVIIFFLEEDKNNNIKSICPVEIGDDVYKEDIVYECKGGIIREKHN